MDQNAGLSKILFDSLARMSEATSPMDGWLDAAASGPPPAEPADAALERSALVAELVELIEAGPSALAAAQPGRKSELIADHIWDFLQRHPQTSLAHSKAALDHCLAQLACDLEIFAAQKDAPKFVN
jgi:hypothetical protein